MRSLYGANAYRWSLLPAAGPALGVENFRSQFGHCSPATTGRRGPRQPPAFLPPGAISSSSSWIVNGGKTYPTGSQRGHLPLIEATGRPGRGGPVGRADRLPRQGTRRRRSTCTHVAQVYRDTDIPAGVARCIGQLVGTQVSASSIDFDRPIASDAVVATVSPPMRRSVKGWGDSGKPECN